MSAPTLPPALAGRFTVSPVVPEDADAILGLVSACDLAVLGFVDYTLEDVQEDTGPTATGEPRQQGLARDSAGQVVAWWWTGPRPDSARLPVDLYVHPGLDEADGDALAALAWAQVTAWGRERYAGWSGEVPLLDTGSIQGDTVHERRLAAAGFERVRTFWRMSGDVPESPAPAPEVPGLVVRTVRRDDEDDTRLVHRLKEESFAEHWGTEPEAYEAFMGRWRGSAGFDPSLWFVAELDGEPAAVMLASRRMANEDALYIQSLGTLAPARGRGVASALLHHAYEVARGEGYARVRLGVDSDNPTGAPGVYRRAGLETIFAMHAWHKSLT
ncbi:MAG: GNAT family N-acetyltransferase [Oryzihumus sp.]